MKSSPNQVTTHNAGWRTQFRFAGNVFWSSTSSIGFSFQQFTQQNTRLWD